MGQSFHFVDSCRVTGVVCIECMKSNDRDDDKNDSSNSLTLKKNSTPLLACVH